MFRLNGCFNTQPPEGGWAILQHHLYLEKCFNTQPPEGGWENTQGFDGQGEMFQHTAARRRLVKYNVFNKKPSKVSTHSRPKAAGLNLNYDAHLLFVSTHSRPKAAGIMLDEAQYRSVCVSTHSRPKAAGMHCIKKTQERCAFQHTAARRRLAMKKPNSSLTSLVSTHSRPKAAGVLHQAAQRDERGFNTQPPEGGWDKRGDI